MSDYWRDNYERQTQRRVDDYCEPRTKNANPFAYIYIQAYNIRSSKITQVLNNTIFVDVTGHVTLSVSWYSSFKMDWDLGFEDLRSDHPRLTVFWETSARKLDYELHKMWRGNATSKNARRPRTSGWRRSMTLSRKNLMNTGRTEPNLTLDLAPTESPSVELVPA
jgi:hypothetical protein